MQFMSENHLVVFLILFDLRSVFYGRVDTGWDCIMRGESTGRECAVELGCEEVALVRCCGSVDTV